MENLKSIIYESELNFMSRCVLDYPDLETGGDFFGFWNKDDMPVVMFVTGPGVKTNRSGTSFYQDIGYLHVCGDFLHANFGLEHVGSWHSHHTLNLEHPSGGDINTMKNALAKINRFFISICNIRGKREVNINGFLFSKDFNNFHAQTRWIVLPNESPIRMAVSRGDDFFTKPKTKDAIFLVDRVQIGKSKNVILKPELAENSYFETSEGRTFLKKEFDKINSHPDCKGAEIIQNEDKTIAIAFDYLGKPMEIRYPNDFSENNPNPIVIERGTEKEIQHHFIREETAKVHMSLFVIFKRIFFGVSHQPQEKNNE